MITIYTKIISHYDKTKKQIENIKQNITKLPNGNLICTRNGNYYKWYQSYNNKYKYIPKKNISLANQLAYKKYLTSLLDDLLHEQQALESYLKIHSKNSSVDQLLSNPELRTLLAPYFTPLSKELSNWMNEPFEQNPKHPEHLIHKSNSGHLLRSKSEAFIDMLLYMHKIPFRYECSLTFDETTLYPDFTIRHPTTGKIYYWEHFGMMDNPSYIQNAYSKLQIYTNHGIIPNIHLITTFEAKKYPLDVDTINKIIEDYFL